MIAESQRQIFSASPGPLVRDGFVDVSQIRAQTGKWSRSGEERCANGSEECNLVNSRVDACRVGLERKDAESARAAGNVFIFSSKLLTAWTLTLEPSDITSGSAYHASSGNECMYGSK